MLFACFLMSQKIRSGRIKYILHHCLERRQLSFCEERLIRTHNFGSISHLVDINRNKIFVRIGYFTIRVIGSIICQTLDTDQSFASFSPGIQYLNGCLPASNVTFQFPTKCQLISSGSVFIEISIVIPPFRKLAGPVPLVHTSQYLLRRRNISRIGISGVLQFIISFTPRSYGQL